MAARHADAQAIADLTRCLQHMREAATQDVLVQYDAEFHARVAGASGNATLASMLAGVSGRTQRPGSGEASSRGTP